jgi:hypothetical protein
MLQQINLSASSKCPCAIAPLKNQDIYFVARRQIGNLITLECINNVTATCKKWKLPTNIIKAIKESIQFWIAHPNLLPPYIHIANQELQDALKDQARIG